ncbi:unnamed protein product [Chilo suppressalis]|uniref:SP-RING-type domain-containing protein n=1 Tax=Chilo suppressalis TaxID=168631 RepID=A0ABN8BAS8_CHISP|nr:unnamed protein product [Chilo suppressalis]
MSPQAYMATKNKWICPTCNMTSRRPKGDETPTRRQFEQVSTDADMSCDDVVEQWEWGELNKKFCEMESRFSAIEDRLIETEKKSSVIPQLKADLDSAKNAIAALELENHKRDQFSRMNNVEISGIPVTAGENLYTLLHVISNKVNCSLSEQDIDSVAYMATKNKWICPTCNMTSRRPKGDETPTRRQFEQVSTDADMSCDDVVEQWEWGELNKKFCEMESRFSAIEDRLIETEKKSSVIPQLKADLDSAKNAIAALELENHKRDQFSRMNNVEISGIPVTAGENLYTLLHVISNKVNCSLSEQDIDSVAYMATKNKWICPTCNMTSRRPKGDETPTRRQFEQVSTDADMSCDDVVEQWEWGVRPIPQRTLRQV